MAYFQELPNIAYPSLLPNRNKSEDRIVVKNIFKRSKLRDDVDQAITAFNYYQIEDLEYLLNFCFLYLKPGKDF